MKTLTPPEAVQALLDDKKVEFIGVGESCVDEWRLINEYNTSIVVLTSRLFIFRLAQEMITIGRVSFPKPESEPLEPGTRHWITEPSYMHYEISNALTWADDPSDHMYPKRGPIHFSRENARLHGEALIKLSGGKIDD